MREVLEERLASLTESERQWIVDNQDNRKSFVYPAILKLQKFGNLPDFLITLTSNFLKEEKTAENQGLHLEEVAEEVKKDQSDLKKDGAELNKEKTFESGNAVGIGLSLIPKKVEIEKKEEEDPHFE